MSHTLILSAFRVSVDTCTRTRARLYLFPCRINASIWHLTRYRILAVILVPSTRSRSRPLARTLSLWPCPLHHGDVLFANRTGRLKHTEGCRSGIEGLPSTLRTPLQLLHIDRQATAALLGGQRDAPPLMMHEGLLGCLFCRSYASIDGRRRRAFYTPYPRVVHRAQVCFSCSCHHLHVLAPPFSSSHPRHLARRAPFVHRLWCPTTSYPRLNADGPLIASA